jgi:hypothetical protein
MMARDDPLNVANLAAEVCLQSLQRFGNELSITHRELIQRVATILALLTADNFKGRYVWTAPAGLGKTRLMISIAKAIVALRVPWSLAICSERVEELETIWGELQEGDYPVPESERAIWHSKPDARIKATFTPEQAKAGMYSTRRILLMTHARLQQSQGEAAQWLRLHGEPRSIVFYDESLQQTGYWSVPFRFVTSELTAALDGMEQSRARVILRELQDALHRERDAQVNGGAPALIRIPEEITRSGPVGKEIEGIVTSFKLYNLKELFFHHNREADLRLVVAPNPANSILLSPYATVPTEELDRMVVLDASWPVRTLLTSANANMAEAAKAQGLQVQAIETVWSHIFEDVTSIKRYDHVTIPLMPTNRSGRAYVTDPLYRRDIIKEIVEVITSEIPPDDEVLVWTFLPHDDVDCGDDLRDALVGRLGTEAADRVTIETFGREQASNAHKHAKHVIFQGCLELPPEHLAAQYVAETRDILAPVSWSDIERINQGEVAHRVYQALHRGRCREALLDADGHTQAKEMHVWLFNRFHKYLQDELGRVMPGVKFKDWEPKHMDKRELAKEALGAIIIRGILANLTVDSISLQAMKKLNPVLREMTKKTFQRARALALGDGVGTGGWMVKGGSLVRSS